ncbi:MAG: aspartate kinase, partial [Anaerolineales bacterium]|nr:aspartate kinase [Anaerolineales bacterium]
MTLVMKFGGTSVGSAAAMKRTAELIRAAQQDWGSVIVVASAMSQVTDLLLRGAHGAIAGDKDAPREVTQLLREKHETALENLVDPGPDFEAVLTEINGLISRYHSLCRAVLVLGELTPRALDVMSSMGERMSVRILAAYLRQIGMPAAAIDADTFIVTDNNFQAASPLDAETAAGTARVIKPLLTEGIIPIVTGFMGATVAGTTTTLGR